MERSDIDRPSARKYTNEQYSNKESVITKVKSGSEFRSPTLNKHRDVLEMASQICKSLHLREPKNLK